jgi:hypothetical protein
MRTRIPDTFDLVQRAHAGDGSPAVTTDDAQALPTASSQRSGGNQLASRSFPRLSPIPARRDTASIVLVVGAGQCACC